MKELFKYYSIGDFINKPDHKTEFEITLFEEMEEPNVDDLHKHTFYEIIWIEEGKSIQVIDYKEYEIKPNSLFFISPGQLHHFEEWQPIKGGSIMFTADFFLLNQNNKEKLFELSFLDNFYANACVVPDKKSHQEITKIIELLVSEKKREDFSKSICQSLLQVLLTQVQRCINKEKNETSTPKYLVLYKKFKNLLDENFDKGLTASDYASRLNITQHHLNHVVKQITNKTSSEVIRERSILEAKRLLTFTDDTITEIASKLLFFDSSYFSKIFKNETGKTPYEFRNLISEKYRKLYNSL